MIGLGSDKKKWSYFLPLNVGSRISEKPTRTGILRDQGYPSIIQTYVNGLVLYFCISAFPRSRLSIVFPSKGVSTVQFWNISATQTAALLTLFVNAADPIDWQRLTMSWTIARQQSKDLSAVSEELWQRWTRGSTISFKSDRRMNNEFAEQTVKEMDVVYLTRWRLWWRSPESSC